MKSKSLVRLGALAILWGSGFLFIKEALTGLSPFQIVFGRMLAAAVAMLALTLATKRRLPTEVGVSVCSCACQPVRGGCARIVQFKCVSGVVRRIGM